MSKVKCRHCGKQIDKQNAIEYKSRQYCCSQECVNAISKPKNTDKQPLYDWLNENLPKPIDWVIVKSVLKQYEKQYGMKPMGMLYSLRYAKEYKGMDITSVSILPYVYGEAERYCKWRQAMKKQVAKSHYGVGDVVEVNRQDVKVEECVFD